jgi:triosephosphate isomerase
MKKTLIVANWKMNPVSLKEAKNLFDAIKEGIGDVKSEVVVCPPFVYLAELKGLILGAQNCFWEERGTYTGDISPAMLKDLEVKYVIVGHSERRKYFLETDEQVNKKIKIVLKTGLNPILCVGENAEQRENGETEAVLKNQLMVALSDILVSDLENLTIAYEPVWAISSGDPYKTKELPTSESIKKTHNYIRELLAGMYDKELAEGVRIIYGGSANAKNVKDYLENAQVQGFLVGGASLMPDDFLQIVKVAG